MAGIYGGGATLDTLNDWLQTITGLTFDSRAYLEQIVKNTGGTSGAGGGSAATSAEAKDWPKRLDEAIERFGKRVEGAVGRLGSVALSQAQAIGRRGFSGTVEGARLDYAMEQLSRQMAAVFMPIMSGMTYLAGRLEKEFRGMGGGEQNRMMGTMVGGVAGLRMGGVPGMVAGGMLGALAMGDPRANDTLTGAAAGAYAGFRLGGPVGAFLGAGAGAIAGSPASREGESMGDFYSRLRREGSSVVGASLAVPMRGLSMMGGDIMRGVGIDTDMGRRIGERRMLDMAASVGLRAGEAPRRDVTPFQAQMGEAGSTFFRMQEAMIRVTAGAEFEDAGPLKPIIDLLVECVKWLMTIGGATVGGSIAAPASAERAR